MKKLLLMLCAALSALLVAAQVQKPEWYEAGTRNMLYPDADYFIGFSSGFARQGESMSAARDRVKMDAQADAASRIQVHVKSESLDAVRSIQRQTAEGFDEDIRTLFAKQTCTSTSMDIPNLQVLDWADPASREVAVLVYAKRRNFVRFYDRQVESLLGKMEVVLDNALEQERQGSQIKGRTTAEGALVFCPQVEYAQRMMALGDVNATMDDLQMPRYTTLVKRILETIARLRHATTFYVVCNATIGGRPYSLFNKEVRGNLAEHGCNFTDNKEAADWAVQVDAEVINTQHKEGMPWFSFVDGDITVYNGRTGQKVLNDRLSALEDGHYDGIKGGDFNPDKAARIAYRNVARIVADAVLKLVKE